MTDSVQVSSEGLKAATNGRRTELGLLVVSAVIVLSAYILASLGRTATLPAHIVPFLAAILGLSLAAHVATRRLAPEANPIVLPVVVLLNGLGYVMIARLNYRLALNQATWTAIGIGSYILTLAVVRRSKGLERYRYILALVGLVLLLMPLLPKVGQNINGSRLWIRFGPLSFQPVELAKLALAVFFASYLVEKKELLSTPTAKLAGFLLPDPRPFGPILLVWGFSLLVMMAEHDVGFSLLLFMLFIVLLWISTGRTVYLLIGAVLFVVGAVVANHLLSQVHVRIAIWLDPWKHPVSGYQIIQGEYALGSGGVAGTGLGIGYPGFIPIVWSDFIFAAFGEEMGLAGTGALLMSYVILVGAGLRAAVSARSDFSKVLATGLTFLLGFQAFLIMAGVIRILPLTGVTLPFVAYGGSSLVSNYILVALLMRISGEAADSPP